MRHMRILFYSTSSNHYDGEAIKTTTFPSWSEQWDFLASKHPEHEFIIATQLPGMFLLDVEKNEIAKKSSKIRYQILQSDKEKQIAEELACLKPDLAVALSFYVMPYDWLPIKDAIVADFLRSAGIRTICHSVETSLICFDKWQTHQFLEKIGVPCAKAVYLHHELYINAGNRREIKSNVFTTAVFHQIKKLNFPLIIKDTTGLSSFGADVVHSYDDAIGILRSKKTTSDRIIEEMIQGIQAGAEIYGIHDGTHGMYTVFPPFLFSVNQYGITSPKQSEKTGPITKSSPLYEKYKISELTALLLKLADELQLNGIAQIDLVFNGKNWFVIEINPRLSGMSTSYAASSNRFLSELIWEEIIERCLSESFSTSEKIFRQTINQKIPLLGKEELNALFSRPEVVFVHQIENKAAKQIREQGYCEVISTTEKD